ncbi:SRPBCC domain-containing protein [Thermopolyspora sp. NPDC052614]|uniref:SRPBCC domain-containing protein n=1 Tax=Thermopolyspora sp. NPDC052614 TaxID=3155682 RepID=UPI00342E7DEB
MNVRVDRAVRVVAASPPRVYQAFVTADEYLAWLPPDGMTGRMIRFDARPGGGYRMELRYRDPQGAPGKTTADADVVDVRFIELRPPSRIVQEVDFDSDDPAFAGSMRMTWTFVPVEGGTKVEVRCENVPPGIRPEDHAAGLTASLANLAAFVENP